MFMKTKELQGHLNEFSINLKEFSMNLVYGNAKIASFRKVRTLKLFPDF